MKQHSNRSHKIQLSPLGSGAVLLVLIIFYDEIVSVATIAAIGYLVWLLRRPLAAIFCNCRRKISRWGH